MVCRNYNIYARRADVLRILAYRSLDFAIKLISHTSCLAYLLFKMELYILYVLPHIFLLVVFSFMCIWHLYPYIRTSTEVIPKLDLSMDIFLGPRPGPFHAGGVIFVSCLCFRPQKSAKANVWLPSIAERHGKRAGILWSKTGRFGPHTWMT